MSNKTKERVIWAVIIMLFTAAATVGACSANAASVPQIHATIVESDSTTAKAEKVGTITVEKDGKSKTYDLYRGKRGGYYYFTGKTTKEGKQERKYLTKKQKEENNLK